MDTRWMTLSETVKIELYQSMEEGRDVKSFEEDVEQILENFKIGQLREEDARILIDRIKNSPIKVDYSYFEPVALLEIKKLKPKKEKTTLNKFDKNSYYNKIYGAWLGRCAGCLLGQPVEGWMSNRILGMLKETGNYPIHNYLSSAVDKTIRQKYSIVDEGHVYGSNFINWINNVSYMPEDDDTNYTILYLKILETYGRDFTSENVAHSWLMDVPIYHVCTAERVAYMNLVNRILPPLSGSYYNAYREWIGAQIRADLFGYINPGDTEMAAEFAWRDARISHVKNGIYGEMFCAAMIARGAVSDDIIDIIKQGLGEIPEKSRLTEGIEKVLNWFKQGLSWEKALEKIHLLYDEGNNHHWCHTISNAMICTIALLWGEKDLEKTIGIAVCAGFDTDCNAATTGSIIGIINGASNLPEKWIAPLNNKVKSGIDGFGLTEISELAERTMKIVK
ncbi:ADP-ribosylglycohydrolase family protein [Leadbettera azotonutricia]|uniref:ADP-ribosylation/Crystallin J1 n=1 Tax=Leadbettera azotonutricia (strain ATCC BAA-888 / DSM 13862 / ZAS-9) TaxID=545695 RepID=F5YDY1_LEAAZ|nr:ADP-ribosylglycohydrolase family protein [Leadbettera azotonutricia]AEF82398.1 ADP-ribosylation/Crystallin J1 [Leadbettera azotonutricia ZAS-9]